MSSPCRIRVWAAAGLALALAACEAPHHRSKRPPLAQGPAPLPAVSHLFPAGPPSQAEPAQFAAFEKDPTHIANGKRLFTAYNCEGCHFNGGGGIGPAFMDPKWRYGGSLEEIHNSIAEGRPNGMPVWRRMIPDPQIWEIAAYVHSLAPPPPGTAAGAGPSNPPPAVGVTTSASGQTATAG